jgi:O-antigen ligase
MTYLFKKPSLLFLAISIFFTIVGIIDELFLAFFLLGAILLIVQEDGKFIFKRKSIFLLFLFYIVVFVYSIFGLGTLDGDSLKTHMFSIITMLFAFSASYHLKKCNSNQLRSFLILFVITLSISVIATTYVGFLDPMALREYGFGNKAGYEMTEAAKYHSMGMMSYSVAHAMSVASVGLSVLICYEEKKWVKIIALVLLLLIVRLLFVMTITTALLLAVIGSVIIIASYSSKGGVIRTLLFALLLFVAFFLTGISALFLDFSESSNTQIFAKLEDVFSFLQTGTSSGQLEGREDLYTTSINSFLSNPIFGGAKDNGTRTAIGQHSFIMDYLAYYGLFALLFFIAWWKEFKMCINLIDRKLRNGYILSFIPAIALVVLKAETVCSVLPFMTLIFIQVVFLYENSKKGEHINIRK